MIDHREKEWDEFIIQNGGSFLQSYQWAEFQESVGREVYRCHITSTDGGIRAQFTLFFLPLPFQKKYAYVPHGPVVRLGDKKEEYTNIFETALESIYKKSEDENAVFSHIEPFLSKENLFLSNNDFILLGMKKAKSIQPSDTLVIDLQKNEEDLLSLMHQKTRYNIRLAERSGITVRDAEYENEEKKSRDIDTFIELLKETSERDKFFAHQADYYKKLLENLHPLKEGNTQARLVFAELNGKPIAGGIFITFGKTMTYLHGASSSKNRRVMSPYLLHWTMIKEAKRLGMTMYDFWGVAPEEEKEHSFAGITRFKLGFGGNRVSYVGAWDLPNNRLWYILYRAVKRITRP